MPENGTSGSMSGDGKRSVAAWPKLPRPSSTLPKRTFYACRRMSVLGGKSGHAADITAKTDFDPNGLREHSRDLPIAALVTDRAIEAWYHPLLHE